MKKYLFITLPLLCLFLTTSTAWGKIDRKSVVKRNNPVVTQFAPLNSLSVGNGEFCFTADITGLQTFYNQASEGMPLGTQSNWGWHSNPNTEGYKFEETLVPYNFRGTDELYAVQVKEKGRQQDAVNYYRANPHRLHLGQVGFLFDTKSVGPISPDQLTDVKQELDLWKGLLQSSFTYEGQPVKVFTTCHAEKDQIGAEIISPLLGNGALKVFFAFSYPTAEHMESNGDWDANSKHTSKIVSQGKQSALIQRTLDATTYWVQVSWEGKGKLEATGHNGFTLSTTEEHLAFTVSYSPNKITTKNPTFDQTYHTSAARWERFWSNGGMVDFGKSTDARAKELERRAILSQYLLAIQCSGSIPPQETGLTYNSWYGKFHLEMHWWHALQFALWNRHELLENSMEWYRTHALENAKKIAARQHFKGLRWMKMTDPSSIEAPSEVGSFLMWQQPHYIYFAEILYKNKPTKATLNKYADLVELTAQGMFSMLTYEKEKDRYVLKGLIPAQETMKPAETVNPPLELAYWHYGLTVAQRWMERAGRPRVKEWDDAIAKLSPLAQHEGLYIACETAPQTYKDIRFTSDHPAVLGAYGMMPPSPLVEKETMKRTFDWIWDNWNWDHTWGWDYPLTSMCAVRLNEPEKAVDALLMDKPKNNYLVSGHNCQDERLRVYLPGNGGFLISIALMCAGWEGSDAINPGFPKNDKWDVQWEELGQMP